VATIKIFYLTYHNYQPKIYPQTVKTTAWGRCGHHGRKRNQAGWADNEKEEMVMINHPRIVHIEDYEQFVGGETVDRILKKARQLRDVHVVNVNSTYSGGGVAELLGSMTILMNSVGIKTGWRVIQGSPDFFSITKKMHNALQGGEINLTDRKKEIFEEVVYENAIRTHLEHDVVITTPSPCR
jgi:hypothetical protein